MLSHIDIDPAHNLTQTADGRMKPVQERELYRGQAFNTAVYRAKLAVKVQRLGYEVEVDQRTGAPELKGFTRTTCERTARAVLRSSAKPPR